MLEIIKPGITVEEASGNKARVVVEPLERGFGYTLGNSLRRLMLSSIPGSAVSSVRIEGVPHEFAAIPGVKEDVVDVLLNVKQVVLKSESDDEMTLSLDVSGPKVVTAGDLKAPADVEVINKDLPLATLNGKAKLQMELTVSRGRGYTSADKNKQADQPIGVIPVDSMFTPLRRVTYAVENTRVGQRTDYDKLILDIETNGSITPEDAVATAARIMNEHMSLFIEEGMEEAVPSVFGEEQVEAEANYNIPIEQLELSVRSYNCLKRQGIHTLEQLLGCTEQDLVNIRNFGEKSIDEVRDILASRNLSLKSA